MVQSSSTLPSTQISVTGLKFVPLTIIPEKKPTQEYHPKTTNMSIDCSDLSNNKDNPQMTQTFNSNCRFTSGNYFTMSIM